MEYRQGAMEGMVMNSDFWHNRSVFITGHTGFKGGWIALWLSHMGARVSGYSLNPPSSPNFFTEVQLESRMVNSTIADIRDLGRLSDAIKSANPSVVIHMAAQPLVRESYNAPVETFSTNVMGTVNLLEAVRKANSVEAIVNITTDKCYENKEWIWSYRENDRLGGHDPYSSSKACSELVASAYRNSFLNDAQINLASVRAGNVIGGGDWASDRLIPDFLRSIDNGQTLRIRSPHAVRPWQHALEPISGYLMLAEKLVTQGINYQGAWNFGSDEADAKPVSWIVERLCSKIPTVKWEIEGTPQPHEANLLKLDSSKAKMKLHWKPRWALETALNATIDWHQAWKQRVAMGEYSIKQIESYLKS